MSSIGKEPAALNVGGEQRLRPRVRVRVRLLVAGEEPMSSNFSVLGKGERIFHVDPEIANCILDLAMS